MARYRIQIPKLCTQLCVQLDAEFASPYQLCTYRKLEQLRILYPFDSGMHIQSTFKFTPHASETHLVLLPVEAEASITLHTFKIGATPYPLDAIYYINLAHRPERRMHICKELTRMNFPEDKIHRVDAVYLPRNPQIGCAMSHMRAISNAAKRGHERILILEDDFTFTCTSSQLETRLHSLDDAYPDWEVAMMATVHHTTNSTRLPHLRKVVKADTTSGYVLRSSAFMSLFSVFRNCSRPHPEAVANQYAIDVAWQQLQPHMQWFLFYPMIGKQCEEFPSDIEKERTSLPLL